MSQAPVLKFYNSMTRRKDPFVPSDETCLTWYNCGPTVYDASHMGHARSYVSFDIIRRILMSYFNYNISYVMNITDIDDKIIFRARRNYLIDNYIQSSHPVHKIIDDANEAIELLEDKIVVSKYLDLLTIMEKITAQQNKIENCKDNGQLQELEKAKTKLLEAKAEITKDPEKLAVANDSEHLSLIAKKKLKLKECNIALTDDPNKLAMFDKTRIKATKAVQSLRNNIDSNQSEVLPDNLMQEFFIDVRDPLSELLDRKFGTSVNDHEIFARLARRWENDFNDDMKALNVLPADTITRVSEYVPEVIEFVQAIVNRNYAYVSNGSVYFDTVAFNNSPNHRYGKLLPEAIGDLSALAEGEGELSIGDERLREKKSPNDFVLWKCSKPGEPHWDSPWGKGRPGWHIECSVMASAILGKNLDIHSGGVDLKFPHHENEIAQVEAYYDSDEWIKYFLHSGHLKIEGCKMSKSLKNFITIKEALNKHSARQLRLAFLSHPWNTTMDYSENSMSSAIQTEKLFLEFFLNVKDIDRVYSLQAVKEEKWNSDEIELDKSLRHKQNNVHRALCDSIDTPTAMKELKELVNLCNSYIATKRSLKQLPNARLLKKIASYIVKMLRIFGVVVDEIETTIGFPQHLSESGINKEDIIMPYLTVLADFRADVRDSAREKKVPELLTLCDDIRNDVLPNLGVRLEDLEDGPAIKLVDKAILMKEKEMRLQALEEKRLKKEEARQKELERKAQQDAKMKISPNEMFLEETDKYSKFNEMGIPTHDHEGNELSGKLKKKLLKQYEAQKKLHLQYLSPTNSNA